MNTLSNSRQALAKAVSVRTPAGAQDIGKNPIIEQPATPVILTDYVRDQLDKADLLLGVPLSYLLPDPALLPAEALRFFTIDPDWVLAFRRGMLCAGSPDAVTPETDTGAERGAGLTGLLLSSALVAQYPGLILRAWNGTNLLTKDPYDPASGATPVTLLRRENLTSRVLLCIFATPPDLVIFEEPHGFARLGVRRDTNGNCSIALRDNTGTTISRNSQLVSTAVPFRGAASDGVIDVTALAQSLWSGLQSATTAANRPPNPQGSSAGFGWQLLQPPVRQRYSREVTS